MARMSHSYRKTPMIGIGGNSDKKDKQQYNRSFRKLMKVAVKKMNFDMLPEREFNGHHSRSWDFNKEGKIRFDPKKHPELMRK
jgi:hypothetical protein